VQELDPERTCWHITFGTYGTRLHGSSRPTVDLRHNIPGTPFLPRDARREVVSRERMRFEPVALTAEQALLIEDVMPAICERGGWGLRACAAQDNHVHVLVDVSPGVHGERIRRLIKRWMGQALSERWPRKDGASWWAEQGSNIAVRDEAYLNKAYDYVVRQRCTP